MDSTFTTFDFFVLLAGVVGLLKKVTEGNRNDGLRVFVLTTVLSCVVIYFFLVYGFTLGNPIDFESGDRF